MEADPKIRFDYLHKELVEYQVRFVDMCFKGAGLSLLILGWMLTSESARKFIASNTTGRAAAVAGVLIIELAYALIISRMTRVLHHIARELDALEYLPRSYYEFRVYPPRVIAAAAAVVTSPALVAVVLMLFR